MSMTLDIPVAKAVAVAVQLTKDNATFDMSSATAKAAIVSTDNAKLLSGVVAPSSGLAGADWAQSLLVIHFAAADTASITERGPAEIEITITADGFNTPFYVACRLVTTHT